MPSWFTGNSHWFHSDPWAHVIYFNLIVLKNLRIWDFPGGIVLKNPPASRNTGSTLVREDPTCHRAAASVCHDYRLRAPSGFNYWAIPKPAFSRAREPQPRSACAATAERLPDKQVAATGPECVTTEACALQRRSHHSEACTPRPGSRALTLPQPESPRASNEDPV